MRLEAAWVLGWVATILAIGFNLPQAHRSCVRGMVGGIPPARLWLSLQNSVLWLFYGLSGAGAVQIVCNAVNSVIGIAILVTVYRLMPKARRTAPRWALGLTGVLLIAIALNAVGGPAAVGTAAALATVLPGIPQLVALVRNPDVSGLSPVSCILGVACTTAWLAHGILLGDAAIWAPNVWQLFMGTLVLVLLARAYRRTRAAAVPAVVAVPVAAAAPVTAAAPVAVTGPVTATVELPALALADLASASATLTMTAVVDATTELPVLAGSSLGTAAPTRPTCVTGARLLRASGSASTRRAMAHRHPARGRATVRELTPA
ncbi:SemiSWEET family transporter [Cryptosporangium minutisporangium]|uniref:PQ-loop repeat-containing protein n=1 Tax=Cryptosporangium minutisporangium TaxID=113569 RepID=A0ABP6TA32_9ACTN